MPLPEEKTVKRNLKIQTNVTQFIELSPIYVVNFLVFMVWQPGREGLHSLCRPVSHLS